MSGLEVTVVLTQDHQLTPLARCLNRCDEDLEAVITALAMERRKGSVVILVLHKGLTHDAR